MRGQRQRRFADAAIPDAAAKGPLYAFTGSSDGQIRAFLVDAAAGTLTPKGATAAEPTPFLAVDTRNSRVFAVDETNSEVLAFGFDPQTAAFVARQDLDAWVGAGTCLGQSDGKLGLGGELRRGSVAVFPCSAMAPGAASDSKAPAAAHLLSPAPAARTPCPMFRANPGCSVSFFQAASSRPTRPHR